MFYISLCSTRYMVVVNNIRYSTNNFGDSVVDGQLRYSSRIVWNAARIYKPPKITLQKPPRSYVLISGKLMRSWTGSKSTKRASTKKNSNFITPVVMDRGIGMDLNNTWSKTRLKNDRSRLKVKRKKHYTFKMFYITGW